MRMVGVSGTVPAMAAHRPTQASANLVPSQDEDLCFDSTVPRQLVHRAAIAEVFLTDARQVAGGHFRVHLWPAMRELRPDRLRQAIADHLRLRVPPGTGRPDYNVLQKLAYSSVIFVMIPLTVLSGLAMSPAIGAAVPLLPRLFGGFQSARTVHFFAFAVLVLFVVTHIVMVVVSGFRKQIRAMTWGE